MQHDSDRVVLSATPFAKEKGVKWFSMIHPFYAMLFSLISTPKEKKEAIMAISYFFSISKEKAEKLIEPFINNDEHKSAIYEGIKSFFPKDVIIQAEEIYDYEEYEPKQFIFKNVDTEFRRMKLAPYSILLIINNTCATNCIYCYADKVHKCEQPLSFEEIVSILNDAKSLGIRDFQIIGGEFFLFNKWEELLTLMEEMGFHVDMLSTKIPLSKEQIAKFKRFGIRLQISLDSLNTEILQSTLNVSESYSKNIQKTIKEIDASGIRYQIATVLTRETANTENLNILYDFINTLDNVIRWEIRCAFRSLYTAVNFSTIQVPTSFYETLEDWYKKVIKSSNKNIQIATENDHKYRYSITGSNDFEGSRCSANRSNMVILPDGKVTICEQLYWNPRFIIGDIRKNNIREIWTGERAIALAEFKQSQVQKKSLCSDCEIYEKCHKFVNICIANVLKAYGDENWDFPDPRCEKAPEFFYPL